jgi:hypothetical protein
MGQIDRLNRKDKEMKFMIPFLMAAVLPAAALAQSQAGAQSPSGAQTQPAGGSGVPGIAIPKTTEVIVIETPKQGVTPQQVMAVIPEEIKATVKLYLDGKIRQWYSRGDGKGVVFMVDAKTADAAITTPAVNAKCIGSDPQRFISSTARSGTAISPNG